MVTHVDGACAAAASALLCTPDKMESTRARLSCTHTKVVVAAMGAVRVCVPVPGCEFMSLVQQHQKSSIHMVYLLCAQETPATMKMTMPLSVRATLSPTHTHTQHRKYTRCVKSNNLSSNSKFARADWIVLIKVPPECHARSAVWMMLLLVIWNSAVVCRECEKYFAFCTDYTLGHHL